MVQNTDTKPKASGILRLTSSPSFFRGAVAIAGIALSVVGWQSLKRHQRTLVAEETRLQAEHFGREIVARLDARALALRRMALRWRESPRVYYTDLSNEAMFYEGAMPGYRAIGWVDPSGRSPGSLPSSGTRRSSEAI